MNRSLNHACIDGGPYLGCSGKTAPLDCVRGMKEDSEADLCHEVRGVHSVKFCAYELSVCRDSGRVRLCAGGRGG